jgi:uncharacterized membrane protein YozB (DUF420 family)
MKPWKVALGLGAACVACCAVPIAAGVATLAAAWSALAACADELVPFAWAAAGVALLAGVLWIWRRRVAAQRATCACPPVDASHGEGGCSTGAKNATC